MLAEIFEESAGLGDVMFLEKTEGLMDNHNFVVLEFKHIKGPQTEADPRCDLDPGQDKCISFMKLASEINAFNELIATRNSIPFAQNKTLTLLTIIYMIYGRGYT